MFGGTYLKKPTTHHFRQGIVEARDNAIEYCEFLKKEYQLVVDSVEGKRVDNMNVMKEIEKNVKKINIATTAFLTIQ